jgi:hypothetical protein
VSGHPGGGLARTGYINGTYPTPVRLRLVAAVQEPGRIYGEAGEVGDKATGFKVTRRIGEQIAAKWIEAVPREGYRDDWSPQRTYFRVSDNEFGKAVIERGRRG